MQYENNFTDHKDEGEKDREFINDIEMELVEEIFRRKGMAL